MSRRSRLSYWIPIVLLVLPFSFLPLLIWTIAQRRKSALAINGEGNGIGAVDATCGLPPRMARTLYALAAAVFAVCCLVTVGRAQATVSVPEHSQIYRLQLEQAVTAEWGINAPVARLAAQIHKESHWRPNVASKYAAGLSQFTPATAKWIPTICPQLGAFDPWDAYQSIRAMVCYDAWLLRRANGATECDRWAFALADYNGGSKWRLLEQKAAAEAGLDQSRWFGHVATRRARSESAWKENRDYVHRILRVIEHAYIAAGWTGKAACP